MEQLLSLSEIVKLSKTSKTTVNRRSRDPFDPFPAPRRVGPHSIRWLASEWAEYLAGLPKVEAASSAPTGHSTGFRQGGHNV